MHLQRFLPFLSWAPMVNRRTLRADFLAGLTIAFISLPQGIAFAVIAGLPPVYGLYAAMVTPIIAALWGSSWHMVSGPANIISIVVFASIEPYAHPGTETFIALTMTLTLMAGVIQLLLGFARLGRVVDFVSHTVVVGFTAGAAVLIAVGQIKEVTEIELPRGLSFVDTLYTLSQSLEQAQWRAIVVAIATVSAALILKRMASWAPHLLLAVCTGAVVALILDPQHQHLNYVGEIHAGLPPLALPNLSLSTLRDLAPTALALALLGLIEAVSIARALAARSRQRIESNQEFIGQGLSNVIGAFCSSYAGSGSFTRSGVNLNAGAKTPLASVFAALLLGLILLLVAPLVTYLPLSGIGAIIILAAINLMHISEIKKIIRAGRAEWWVLLVTFLATLFLQLEFAIYTGVLLSLTLYLNRTARPRIFALAPNPNKPKRQMGAVRLNKLPECPQLRMVSIQGSLFFGAVPHMLEVLEWMRKNNPQQAWLLLFCEGVNYIDLAGAEALSSEIELRTERGGGVILVGVKDEVRQALISYGVLNQDEQDMLFAHKTDAIADAVDRLDESICSRCQKRIFRECSWRPNLDDQFFR